MSMDTWSPALAAGDDSHTLRARTITPATTAKPAKPRASRGANRASRARTMAAGVASYLMTEVAINAPALSHVRVVTRLCAMADLQAICLALLTTPR